MRLGFKYLWAICIFASATTAFISIRHHSHLHRACQSYGMENKAKLIVQTLQRGQKLFSTGNDAAQCSQNSFSIHETNRNSDDVHISASAWAKFQRFLSQKLGFFKQSKLHHMKTKGYKKVITNETLFMTYLGKLLEHSTWKDIDREDILRMKAELNIKQNNFFLVEMFSDFLFSKVQNNRQFKLDELEELRSMFRALGMVPDQLAEALLRTMDFVYQTHLMLKDLTPFLKNKTEDDDFDAVSKFLFLAHQLELDFDHPQGIEYVLLQLHEKCFLDFLHLTIENRARSYILKNYENTLQQRFDQIRSNATVELPCLQDELYVLNMNTTNLTALHSKIYTKEISKLLNRRPQFAEEMVSRVAQIVENYLFHSRSVVQFTQGTEKTTLDFLNQELKSSVKNLLVQTGAPNIAVKFEPLVSSMRNYLKAVRATFGLDLPNATDCMLQQLGQGFAESGADITLDEGAYLANLKEELLQEEEQILAMRTKELQHILASASHRYEDAISDTLRVRKLPAELSNLTTKLLLSHKSELDIRSDEKLDISFKELVPDINSARACFDWTQDNFLKRVQAMLKLEDAHVDGLRYDLVSPLFIDFVLHLFHSRDQIKVENPEEFCNVLVERMKARLHELGIYPDHRADVAVAGVKQLLITDIGKVVGRLQHAPRKEIFDAVEMLIHDLDVVLQVLNIIAEDPLLNTQAITNFFENLFPRLPSDEFATLFHVLLLKKFQSATEKEKGIVTFLIKVSNDPKAKNDVETLYEETVFPILVSNYRKVLELETSEEDAIEYETQRREEFLQENHIPPEISEKACLAVYHRYLESVAVTEAVTTENVERMTFLRKALALNNETVIRQVHARVFTDLFQKALNEALSAGGGTIGFEYWEGLAKLGDRIYFTPEQQDEIVKEKVTSLIKPTADIFIKEFAHMENVLEQQAAEDPSLIDYGATDLVYRVINLIDFYVQNRLWSYTVPEQSEEERKKHEEGEDQEVKEEKEEEDEDKNKEKENEENEEEQVVESSTGTAEDEVVATEEQQKDVAAPHGESELKEGKEGEVKMEGNETTQEGTEGIEDNEEIQDDEEVQEVPDEEEEEVKIFEYKVDMSDMLEPECQEAIFSRFLRLALVPPSTLEQSRPELIELAGAHLGPILGLPHKEATTIRTEIGTDTYTQELFQMLKSKDYLSIEDHVFLDHMQRVIGLSNSTTRQLKDQVMLEYLMELIENIDKPKKFVERIEQRSLESSESTDGPPRPPDNEDEEEQSSFDGYLEPRYHIPYETLYALENRIKKLPLNLRTCPMSIERRHQLFISDLRHDIEVGQVSEAYEVNIVADEWGIDTEMIPELLSTTIGLILKRQVFDIEAAFRGGGEKEELLAALNKMIHCYKFSPQSIQMESQSLRAQLLSLYEQSHLLGDVKDEEVEEAFIEEEGEGEDAEREQKETWEEKLELLSKAII